MQARWKTITGIAAVVVVIVLSLALRPNHREPVSPLATVPKWHRIFASKPDQPTQPARVSTPPASSTDTAVKKPELQVCGMGDLPPSVDASDVNRYIADATRETYERWKSVLLDSSDVRARAAGLSLQRVEDGFAGSLAADTSLDQLVELAVTARDPVVYGVAVGACKTGLPDDTAAACRRLSLSEWAKIDPDNAVPWLATAAAARGNGDSWAESVAFARAAQTHKVDNYTESLLSVALGARPH